MSWLGQARRRNQRLGAIAYDGGSLSPKRLDLRNAGYLERIRVTQTLSGQYGTAGPTASDLFAILGGFLQRITITANSVGVLFDTSGFMAAVISAIDANWRRGGFSLPNIPVAPTGYTIPALSGQNAFVAFGSVGTAAFADQWGYDIPIALQLDNKPWPMGLFQTALNSQETAIEVRMSPVNATVGVPGSGIYVPGGGATGPNGVGNSDFQQIYYDPIQDPQSQPSLAFVHQWREWQMPLTADGDNEIRLPPSNYYLRVIMAVVTGAAGALALDSTHVTRIRTVYGANLTPYDEPIAAIMTRQLEDYNFTLPPGVYIHDFIKEARTERDIINSAATTDLREIITTSGATYSGGAYVRIAAEQLIPLIVPAQGQATVQGAANIPA